MSDLIVASHQPDLFPHTGFWYKFAKADVFDLAIHDQFQLEGYQRRVKMRGNWAAVRLLQKKTYCPITDLEVHPEAGERLWDMIRGRYEGSKFWRDRQDMVHGWLEKAFVYDQLWMVNTSLLQSTADWLGLDPMMVPAQPQELQGAERVAERVARLGGTVYLSGAGAAAYMDKEDAAFASRGIRIEWSKHRHTTSDSILTPIFDDLHPMERVMLETVPLGVTA